MALLDASSWQAIRGITVTGADLASATAICSAVSAAAVRLMRGNNLELATYTELYDSPWNSNLITLRQGPVNSITSVYVRSDAQGDTSLFTADYLQVQYTDYVLAELKSDQ